VTRILSQPLELPGDPIRIPAEIQHGSNENIGAADLVVNAIRKALGKEAVKTSEMRGMNPGESLERVDVGLEGVQEVIPRSVFLRLVKTETATQVLKSR
jgi:hypothetical protein